MTKTELESYIEGFIKEATDHGLSQAEAVELMMKIASSSPEIFSEDQMVDVD
jgi:hypothetical protein